MGEREEREVSAQAAEPVYNLYAPAKRTNCLAALGGRLSDTDALRKGKLLPSSASELCSAHADLSQSKQTGNV